MQTYNEYTSEFDWKSSIAQKNICMKGKENGLNSPTCRQPGMPKPTVEKLAAQDPPKSKLPILSKAKQPPDFQKLHQSWQNQFQKGKAVKKKSCTRPQPFNFSQKSDRSLVTTDAGQSVNLQSHRRREPLAEVTLGQKNLESRHADVKGVSEEFKADPAALASILSNVGVPIAATGKLSLAQRVPMRVSSIAQSSNIGKNTMVRSSMYAVLRSQSSSSNLDRMSCFSKMQTKVTDQKLELKQNLLSKSHVSNNSLKEPVASKLGDPQQSQENPVLQQMNQTGYAQASGVTSLPLKSQEVATGKSPPLPPVTEDEDSSVLPEEKCEKNMSEMESCVGERDLTKKAGSASVEFVADSQALASILSNTGVAIGNCGKLSLAQRVPLQSRNVSVKSNMTSSSSVAIQATTPKPCFGRMSTMAVPIKDLAFSPCRVPKTVMTDNSSSGSAQRVHQLNSSAMKFSHRSTSKQPFFPKTPRALALEMANKKLETELSDTRPSARSTVKWADELSPSTPEILCKNESNIEQVAVRLFLDVECPGETEKKKEPTTKSDCLKESENQQPAAIQKTIEATQPGNANNNAGGAASEGASQDLPVHTNMHPPSTLSQPNIAEPHVQYTSIVTSMKPPLPLSFLSHPAVQALQSHTLGSYSLPEIARLRIQAAVSAKQRFWETCLDEECAFYTSRAAVSSYRSCTDPVSSFLDRQEDLHFTPIIPEES
ncbi:tastin [Leptodactylus fuscus]|uniref:tastin n=1 Tax=Leptodactylus fuscus TaxID=238119 RepID=UPI003F4EA107